MSGNGSEKQNNGKKLIIIIIILAVLLVGVAILLAFILGKKAGSKNQNVAGAENDGSREVMESSRIVLNEEEASSVLDDLAEQVAEGMFECRMSMTWTFENGSSESKDAYVANSENNTHPIFFDVYLKDTDELIYSSPVLSVGTELHDFTLDKVLDAGEYRAKVKYTLIDDVENQNAISSAGFMITIKVLN